jgi:hypothetical protein
MHLHDQPRQRAIMGCTLRLSESWRPRVEVHARLRRRLSEQQRRRGPAYPCETPTIGNHLAHMYDCTGTLQSYRPLVESYVLECYDRPLARSSADDLGRRGAREKEKGTIPPFHLRSTRGALVHNSPPGIGQLAREPRTSLIHSSRPQCSDLTVRRAPSMFKQRRLGVCRAESGPVSDIRTGARRPSLIMSEPVCDVFVFVRDTFITLNCI